MCRVLPSIIVVFALMISSPSFGESAGEMSSNCRKIADAKVSGDTISYVQDHDTGVCWGAFLVLQDMVMVIDDSVGKKRIFSICPPSESRRLQYILIFLKYAKDHPEQLHEDFLFVALDSLRKTWPCDLATGRPTGERLPKKK